MKEFDFDALMDEVLREDAQVEPRPGMERRILAGMQVEVSRTAVPRRWLRLWWMPAGACLGVVLGLSLIPVVQHGRRERVDSRAAAGASVTDARSIAGDAEGRAERREMPLYQERKPGGVSRVAKRGSALRVERTGEVAETRLPKMETFPAVAQRGGFLPEPASGSGAKELREAVDSPQVAQALQGLKAEQERPLQVSAIEIKPL